MGLSQLICYPQVAHQIDELVPFILNYLSPFGGDSRDSKKEYPYCCFSDRFGSGTLAGGSKILISRRICCLCARRVSWDLRWRQQNPTSKACLLPLCCGSGGGSGRLCLYFCSGWRFRLPVLALRLRQRFRPAVSALRFRRRFRPAVFILSFRLKASIFVRKTLQVLPCEIKKL